jgi:malate dehydrogenase (oxaloacetate-decarboxylating)(NADP+)
VQQAVAFLDPRRRHFEYDGEMSSDLALDAQLMHELYPFCRRNDAANILVMRGLANANLTAKSLGFGGALRNPMIAAHDPNGVEPE